MRSPVLFLLTIGTLAATMVPRTTSAQIEDNLSAYTETNAQGYLEPLRDTLSSGFAGGLYTSAAIPRSRVYVRLEARAMLVRFGDDDRFFTARTEDYYAGGVTTAQAPTVVGPEDGLTITDDGPGGSGASFTFPGGLDVEQLPLAAPQLVFGGIAGTEVLLRWFDAELGDDELGDLSLFGIGARHSISQYLPGAPVELAGLFAYQSFGIGDDLIDFSMVSVGVQASRRFSVIEPYVGLGFDRSSMSVDYETDLGGTGTQRISVDFDSETTAHLTLGAALRLTVLHLNGEVSVGDRTTFALGLSLGN